MTNLRYGFLAFYLLITIATLGQSRYIVLASGSKGGNYFKSGELLAQRLSDCSLEKDIINISTNGSNENIELLKSRFADLAIIQRNVLLENFYDQKDALKSIEVLAPLFMESHLIYTNVVEGGGLITYSEYDSLIQSGIIKQIGIGSENSYSNQIYHSVNRLLRKNHNRNVINLQSYAELIKKFRAGDIQALAIFSSPLKELSGSGNAIVTFEEQEVGLIVDHISSISSIKLKHNNLDAIPANSELMTLGSWAFLVGLSEKIEDIESKTRNGNLVQCLVPEATKLGSSYNLFDINNNLAALVEDPKVFKEPTNGIPLNPVTASYIRKSSDVLGKIIKPLFFLIIITFLFLYLFNNYVQNYFSEGHNWISLWYRFNHIIISIFIVAGLYFLGLELILRAERDIFVELGIRSDLLDLSYKELHVWAIISNLTGEYYLFPISATGKIVVSLLLYLFVFGLATAIGVEYLKNERKKKKIKGMAGLENKNHIVFCGWNGKTSDLLNTTIRAMRDHAVQEYSIVCIVEDSEELIKNNLEVSLLFTTKKVMFVSGDAKDEQVLERANIHEAKSVVLLAEDTSEQADERTLLRALAISRYCSEKSMDIHEGGKLIDSIYIIAEINDPKYKSILRTWDVNEFACTSSYRKNVLVQAMLNHGVADVLDELLEYNEHNEFYLIDLRKEEYRFLREKTFDELLILLRQKDILLLGIKSAYYDEDVKKEIIDEELLATKLKADQIKRQIMINPYTVQEKQRKADDDDQLMVLCTNEKDLIQKLLELC